MEEAMNLDEILRFIDFINEKIIREDSKIQSRDRL